MISVPGKKLVVLTADLDAESAIRGLLTRHESLGIRSLLPEAVDVFRHPQRDSGCCGGSHEFLRPFTAVYSFALVLFDHQGCGRENMEAEDIERDVERRLFGSGWGKRAAAIVLSPELEAWVWSDSVHVASELGWSGHSSGLRGWLRSQGLLTDESTKPVDPKRAMRAALRERTKPPSPGLFRNLAETVSLRHCEDRAFAKFREVLQRWFGPGHSG